MSKFLNICGEVAYDLRKEKLELIKESHLFNQIKDMSQKDFERFSKRIDALKKVKDIVKRERKKEELERDIEGRKAELEKRDEEEYRKGLSSDEEELLKTGIGITKRDRRRDVDSLEDMFSNRPDLDWEADLPF